VTPRRTTGFVPVTAASDPRRPMPESPAERVAAADLAVGSLVAVGTLLAPRGDEWPLARAAHQLRYWRFVRALCVIAAEAA